MIKDQIYKKEKKNAKKFLPTINKLIYKQTKVILYKNLR
jgi:hypothetical protein